MVPTPTENSNLLCICFLQIIILTSEHTHTKSKKEKAPSAPDINYRLKSEVSIMLHCQVRTYVQPVTQQYKSITVQNAPLHSQ